MSLETGRWSKAYLEITNRCNASCRFCPGHSRPKRDLTEDELRRVLSQLRDRVTYLYFHLMGEPLLHPEVIRFATVAKEEYGFRVMVTTNGILSRRVGLPLVQSRAVFKISLSLHAYEANSFPVLLRDYLDGCLALAEEADRNGTVCALRLWNRGGDSTQNDEILRLLRERYPYPWRENRSGYALGRTVFLEWGDRFDWPNGREERHEARFCHALRSQIGILSDGTVVPCCLDAEGAVPLGNLFTDSLDAVLSSPRAKALYDGFSAHTAVEPLCRTCGFTDRFLI